MEKKGNLVRLLDIDEDFIIDLRYATNDNFTGEKIYMSDECYIDEGTAQLLREAKDIFKDAGFRVKLWDAYRPISAQKRFYEILPDNNFVALPPDMAKTKEFRASHMNGMCVDITLTDMNGNELAMPCGFDEFVPEASLNCESTPEKLKETARYMRSVMIGCGFRPYDGEWWHFYDDTNEPTAYSDFT